MSRVILRELILQVDKKSRVPRGGARDLGLFEDRDSGPGVLREEKRTNFSPFKPELR